MGIPGLDQFMKARSVARNAVTIAGETEKCLVIDGNGLCYFLYKTIDWKYGGQYPEFRGAIIHFFRALLESNIAPVVVFDGIDYEHGKEEEKLRRRRSTIQDIHRELSGIRDQRPTHKSNAKRLVYVLPALALQVLSQTLQEAPEIEVHFADGEADPVVASLANRYNCPVLGEDSDYYIFDLKVGYIPISSLNLTSYPFKGTMYRRHDFCSIFAISPDLCLAVPAVIGNDFLPSLMQGQWSVEVKKGFNPKGALLSDYARRVEQVVHFLSTVKSLYGLLGYLKDLQSGEEMVKQLMLRYQEAAQMYATDSSIPEKVLSVPSTALKFSGGAELPEWMMNGYREGVITRVLLEICHMGEYLLEVLPDNPDDKSSQLCSRSIRQAAYGILAYKLKEGRVKELIRCGCNIKSEDIEPVREVSGIGKLPATDEIECLPKDKKLQVICSVLKCDEHHLDSVRDCWQLVVAATHYWMSEVQPAEKVLKALVFCFVMCKLSQEEVQQMDLPEQELTTSWRERLHTYACWQCCYKDAMLLNNLLNNPLPHQSPALLFDGRLVMYYSKHKKLDSIIDHQLKQSEKHKKLYRKLIKRFPREIVAPDPAAEKKNKKMKGVPEKSKGNPFALLQDAEDIHV